jgi:putative transcriptional regulator
MSKRLINRIKVVLVENNRNNKWLAEKLEKNEATVSRWCTNDIQPSLKTMCKISELLNISIKDLLNDNLNSKMPNG